MSYRALPVFARGCWILVVAKLCQQKPGFRTPLYCSFPGKEKIQFNVHIYTKKEGAYPENSTDINLLLCDMYLRRFLEFLVDRDDPRKTQM